MTEKEFWRLLPKTGWKLDTYGELRRRIKNVGPVCCPITAVAHRKLGEYLLPGEFETAAMRMALSEDFAEEIAAAADDFGDEATRAKLLKHMGLKERA